MTDYCDDAPGNLQKVPHFTASDSLNLVEDRAGWSCTRMFLNWGLADLWVVCKLYSKGLRDQWILPFYAFLTYCCQF
jgi:hypothetical protein